MSDHLVKLLSPEAVAAICQAHGVRNLDLFGSVSSGEARAASDVDLLYAIVCAIDLPAGTGFLGAFFDLRADLEAAFGRKVDLVHDGEFRNPYFKAAVERQRRRLHP